MKHFFFTKSFLSCQQTFRQEFYKPYRFIFADDKKNAEKEENEKSEPVTVTRANVPEVLRTFWEEKKLSSSDVSKALEIFSKGSEEDKKRLVQLLQEGSHGAWNASEFNKFITETVKNLPVEETKDGEETFVKRMKRNITNRTQETLNKSETFIENYIDSSNEQNREIAESVKGLKSDFERLNSEDKKNQREINDILAKLVKEKKIRAEQARALAELDLNDSGAISEWNSIMQEIKDPKTKSGPIDELLKLKKREAANEREFFAKQKQLVEYMAKVNEEVQTKANQEKIRKSVEKSAGIQVKADQPIKFKTLRENPQTKELEEKEEEGVIKDIKFQKIEVKDESGKVIRVLTPSMPSVVVEYVDSETKEIIRTPFSTSRFLRWVRDADVREAIRDQQELEKSIGHKLEKGQEFEYRLLLEADEKTGHIYDKEDKKLKITNIDPARNEIELDQPVMAEPGSTVRKKTFTFSEFAKWFKLNQAAKPIPTLKLLRDELKLWTHTQNEVYERDPAHYPPVEAKEGEVLKYDDANEKEKLFVIRKVNDNKITLDNGESFTPAAFLRWIKDKGVEKKDAEAEAKKETQNIPDEAERKAKEEAIKEQAQQEIDERKAKGEAMAPEEAAAKLPKSTEPSRPTASYLRKLWDGTSFISLGDLFQVGNTVVEFVKRKMGRRQKARVGGFGKNIFGGWGSRMMKEIEADFKGEEIAGENDEVNKQAERMRSMGIGDVLDELYSATSPDLLKAAITVLTEKGELRWDDPRFWDAVNNVFQGNPTWVNRATHLQDLETVIDKNYGEGTFRDFQSKQNGSYSSTKNSYSEVAMQLDAEPDGLKKAMQRLLYDHIRGEHVSAAAYEQFLQGAIENGKMAFEDKIYFLIMGFGAVSKKTGLPLLSMSRLMVMTAVQNKFPVFDYFAFAHHYQYDDDGNIIKDEKGEKKLGRPNVNNFKNWVKEVIEKDLEKGIHQINSAEECKWGENLTKFVHEEVVWNPSVRQRHGKASSNASNWDHDDMHIFGPMMKESSVEQMLVKEMGARQMVSEAGVKNAMAGFNNFMKVKLDMLQQHQKDNNVKEMENDIRDLTTLLRTFIKFDAIVDNRFAHGQAHLTRLSDLDLNSNAGVDSSRPIRQHRDEMRRFIHQLSEKLDIAKTLDQEVMKKYGFSPPPDIQGAQSNAITEFPKILEDRIKRQGSVGSIAKLFLDLQNQEEKGVVKGIECMPPVREKREEVVERTPESLMSYVPEDVRNKVVSIKEIREKLAEIDKKGVGEIRGDIEKRLEEIIKEVDAENYTPEEDDRYILQKHLDRLNKMMNEKRQARMFDVEGKDNGK